MDGSWVSQTSRNCDYEPLTVAVAAAVAVVAAASVVSVQQMP